MLFLQNNVHGLTATVASQLDYGHGRPPGLLAPPHTSYAQPRSQSAPFKISTSRMPPLLETPEWLPALPSVTPPFCRRPSPQPHLAARKATPPPLPTAPGHAGLCQCSGTPPVLPRGLAFPGNSVVRCLSLPSRSAELSLDQHGLL